MKILFFAPHAGIWPHSYPEAVLADSLMKAGNEVIYLNCNGLFRNNCITMSAFGVNAFSSEAEKTKICERCISCKTVLRKQFNFSSTLDIDTFITKDDLTEIDSILANISRDNFIEYCLDGLPLGRTCMYELLLYYKKTSFSFSEEEWQTYLFALRNSLLSYFAQKRFYQEEKPDRVIIYNPLYSVNRVAALLCEKLDIPFYFIHGGGNYFNGIQKLSLSKGLNSTYIPSLKSYYSGNEIQLTPAGIENIYEHYKIMLGSSHFMVYSEASTSNFNLRKKYSVKEKSSRCYYEQL